MEHESLSQSPSLVERILFRSGDIGRLVGEFVLGGIVLLTVTDIALRYLFNRPFAFTVELVELGLSVIVFTSIIVCTIAYGHISLNILQIRFPQRVQAVVNGFFYFVCAGIFMVIAWQCTAYAMRLQDMGQVSMMLKLPYYPFVLVVALCSFLASLVFLSQCIHFVAKAVRA